MIYRWHQRFIIGTALVIVIVTSYSFLSTNQIAEMVQKTTKADSADSTESGIYEDQIITDFPLVFKENDFIKSQENVQRKRRKRIANACRRYISSPTYSIRNPPKNIIVDHEHKFMFCFIPKVACTSWKRIFLVLKGIISDINEIGQFEINHHQQYKLDFFFKQSLRMKKHILEHYTKIMFSRHPMSRVLSAYMNKLAPNTTFARARRWKNLGRRILNGSRQLKPETQYEYNQLTFADFVHFLGSKVSNNKHWREMYEMCSPCNIKYDIIGKFETIEEDANYILETLNLSDIVSFPSSNGSSPTKSSEHIVKYYTQVPKADVRNLYRRYKFDFDLFGYDIPHEIT